MDLTNASDKSILKYIEAVNPFWKWEQVEKQVETINYLYMLMNDETMNALYMLREGK